MVPENVSMYPIEVMETIEEENQRKKASGKIVAMIIGLVVALVGLIIFFLAAASKGSLKIPESSNEATGKRFCAVERRGRLRAAAESSLRYLALPATN